MTLVRFQPRSEGPICDAIRARQRLAIDYGGEERLVEPYVHGRSAAGDELVRAFQVSGSSHGLSASAWRLFRLDRMRSCSMIAEPFYLRDDFHDRDGDIVRVHCQVTSDETPVAESTD